MQETEEEETNEGSEEGKLDNLRLFRFEFNLFLRQPSILQEYKGSTDLKDVEVESDLFEGMAFGMSFLLCLFLPFVDQSPSVTIAAAVVSDPKSRTQDEDKKNTLKLYACLYIAEFFELIPRLSFLWFDAEFVQTEVRLSKWRRISQGFWSFMTVSRRVRPRLPSLFPLRPVDRHRRYPHSRL